MERSKDILPEFKQKLEMDNLKPLKVYDVQVGGLGSDKTISRYEVTTPGSDRVVASLTAFLLLCRCQGLQTPDNQRNVTFPKKFLIPIKRLDECLTQ